MNMHRKRADTALRNAITRSIKHIARGDTDKAIEALMSGAKTARRWLSATHPRGCKLCVGTGRGPTGQDCVTCRGTGLAPDVTAT